MRVFIDTDIEGIAGIDTLEAIDQSQPDYRKACHLLMEDVNAAIAGAFDGGAVEVYVNDGHGGGNNFLKEELDPRAIEVPGAYFKERLKDIDAVFMIGCHAMAGTEAAFLDHTQSSASWFDYRVGGVSYGEIGQVSIWAGAADVPVVMMSGDKAACEEAADLIPGITCACVKTAKERNRAESLDRETTRKMIYEAARQGMENIGKVKPYKITLPTKIEVTLYRSDYCDEVQKRSPIWKRRGRTLYKEITEIESYLDIVVL